MNIYKYQIDLINKLEDIEEIKKIANTMYEEMQIDINHKSDIIKKFVKASESIWEDEKLSECCGSVLIHGDICSECKEHC